MERLGRLLLREGILDAIGTDDKRHIVAKAVSLHLDMLADRMLFEIEVVRALTTLHGAYTNHLNETDLTKLSKPARNPFYEPHGVKTVSLRDAIIRNLQELHSGHTIELRYKMPAASNRAKQVVNERILLYKDEGALRRYVRKSTHVLPVVVYGFDVPSALLNDRKGLQQES